MSDGACWLLVSCVMCVIHVVEQPPHAIYKPKGLIHCDQVLFSSTASPYLTVFLALHLLSHICYDFVNVFSMSIVKMSDFDVCVLVVVFISREDIMV